MSDILWGVMITISGRNVVEEGIFRKTGTVRKQQELLDRIERGEDLELEAGNFSIHECASVLKTFLGNLTEPLATNACYKAHLGVADFQTQDFEKRLYCTQLLLELIPDQYFRLLKDLLFLLNGVAQREEENKMTASNLGMMFSTHILCPKSLSAEDLASKHPLVSRATTFMIENPIELFRLSDNCSLFKEVQKFISRRLLLRAYFIFSFSLNLFFLEAVTVDCPWPSEANWVNPEWSV